MLDTRNFVLARADGSTKWETFKSPADTILLTQVLNPGMTLCRRIIPTMLGGIKFCSDISCNLHVKSASVGCAIKIR
jgi:hypothetical protein